MQFKKVKTSQHTHEPECITILGYGGVGLTVYMALALRNLGHKVCILDGSSTGDILEAFLPTHLAFDRERSAELYGIVAASEVDLLPKADYCICYSGDNSEAYSPLSSVYREFKNAAIVMVTDMYTEHAVALKNVDIEQGRSPEPLLVMLDLVKAKYNTRYLLYHIKKEIPKKNQYELWWNRTDFRARLNIGHEKISLADLSTSYKQVLTKLVQRTTDTELTGKQLHQMLK